MWRHGKFYLPYLVEIFNTYPNLAEEDQVMISNLYAFVLEQTIFPEEEMFDDEMFPFP